MYNYGLIGNCQSSALIDKSGTIAWLCMPRPDSPPVFGQILDEDGGCFSISPVGSYKSEQQYLPNTNILLTKMICENGSEFQITDFCPRFERNGHMYRPNSIFRIVEVLKGNPTIQVSCKPVVGWEKKTANPIRGNSYIDYEIRGESLRLTTNMPLTYLIEGTSFTLQQDLYFGLTWGASLKDDLIKLSQDYLNQTKSYWQTWVKHCVIPSQFQKETIRSALTLKMHCYEDTGAILAAITTSLPEHPGHTRNWDYRFCWLRDAAFVLSAFHNLGHFEEMEGFVKFLLNIAHQHDHSRERLCPVYALDQTLPLPEYEHNNWSGFQDSKPVRSNNQAAEHIQNDVYGELILALTPIYFDERFHHLRTKEVETLLKHLAEWAVQNISKPDAGLWEIRDGWREHSFSNLMCWAGIERITRIHEKGYLQQMDGKWLVEAKEKAKQAVINAVKEGSLRNGPSDDSLDAALLLLPIFRFPDKDLCRSTVFKILDDLKVGQRESGFLYRYIREDDFGKPQSAFLFCSFWLVQALSSLGEKDLANEVMVKASGSANSLGLFSEHFIPNTREQFGNYPQAYSHVGLINAAFAVSPPWSEIL